MNELEDRLRSALEARAHTYEASPQAWIKVRKRTLRSQRRRFWLLALVPTAAAAAALPFFLAAGGGQNGIGTGVVTAHPTTESDGDFSTDVMRDKTPLGDRLILDNPSEHRPMLLWFARTTDARGVAGAVFCEATQSRSGAESASCGDVLIESRPREERAWAEGSTESWPPPKTVLHYGAARDGVAGVSAVAEDGSTVAGTLQRPEGAPLSIWTVAMPSKTRITAFEFTDTRGRVIERVEEEADHVGPEANGRPLGSAMHMPGGLIANVYETPDKTLIWTLDGQEVGMDLVRPKDLMTDMGGHEYPVDFRDHDGRWFGLTTPQTVRVALVFKDGRRVTVNAQADRWKIGVRLFSGTYQRSGDIYLEGFQLIGYDKAGTAIWHENHPAQKPLWPTPLPMSSPR
ncbi:hypothetical protein ACQP1V_00390 [Microtetraspora malaysiensis]|uniref:hypothetical protein n=1 Tax=Microtetraspora malaysiensis TaxID=161358 RepID=UPI003D8F0EC1